MPTFVALAKAGKLELIRPPTADIERRMEVAAMLFACRLGDQW